MTMTFSEFGDLVSSLGYSSPGIPIQTQGGEPLAFEAWRGIPRTIGSEMLSFSVEYGTFQYSKLVNKFGHNYVGGGSSPDQAKLDYENWMK